VSLARSVLLFTAANSILTTVRETASRPDVSAHAARDVELVLDSLKPGGTFDFFPRRIARTEHRRRLDRRPRGRQLIGNNPTEAGPCVGDGTCADSCGNEAQNALP